MEIRLKEKRGPPKLCLIDHALRASWFGEEVPIDPERLKDEEVADVAGHLVESIVGACLLGVRGLNVAHFPERSGSPEVDFVLTAGTRRIPIEVKYRRRVKRADFAGLQSFLARKHYNAPFGIVVSQGEVDWSPPNVVVVPLPTFLMLR